MKISNKKIIVSVLALAMGAALAGSISGSVAWYQYSTRTSAQNVGVSAGTSRNLQVAIKPTSGSASYTQHVDLGTANYRPATYYETTPAFYEAPIYKTAAQPLVTTNEVTRTGDVKVVAYKEFELVFKCEDVVDGAAAAQVAKDVYLSDFEIKYTGSGDDITPAVRVKIDGTNDFVLAQTAGTTVTHGNLDLNNNSADDTDSILVDDATGTAITYYAGSDDSSYSQVAKASAVPTMTDPYNFTNTDNKALTTTTTSGDSAVVKVQIWIEGWHELGTTPSALWDNAYMAQNFEVNMQFACEADE